MSAVHQSPIKRRQSKKIWVGKVPVGAMHRFQFSL